MVFELCYPEYSMHPSFSLWRIMQKLWISRMGKFHMLTNVLYTEQFLRQVEGATQTLLNQEEAESGLLKYPFRYKIAIVLNACTLANASSPASSTSKSTLDHLLPRLATSTSRRTAIASSRLLTITRNTWWMLALTSTM